MHTRRPPEKLKASSIIHLLSYEKAFELGSARSHRNMFAMLGDVMKIFHALDYIRKMNLYSLLANVAIVYSLEDLKHPQVN